MKNGFNIYMEMVDLPKEDVVEQVVMKANRQRCSRYPHTNWFEFFVGQAMSLKSMLWLVQAVFLFFGFVVSFLCVQNHLFSLLRFILSFVPIVIHMLSIPMLLKSLDYETVELENVTYYRYVHVLSARMLFIGMMNLFFISILMLCTAQLSQFSLQQLLFYAIVPYNLCCILSFVIIYFSRHDQSIFSCIMSNAFLSVLLFMLSNTAFYMEEVYLVVWKLLFFITLIALSVVVYYVVRQAYYRDTCLYGERSVLWN